MHVSLDIAKRKRIEVGCGGRKEQEGWVGVCRATLSRQDEPKLRHLDYPLRAATSKREAPSTSTFADLRPYILEGLLRLNNLQIWRLLSATSPCIPQLDDFSFLST
jgi:hypothetical protein